MEKTKTRPYSAVDNIVNTQPAPPAIAIIESPVNMVSAVGLPAEYLTAGYYAAAENGKEYLRPQFVSGYAQEIAAALSPLKSSDMNILLREMKRSKKTALPFEARQTAAYEMLPKAISLVRRKRAPQLLVDFINANLSVIYNDNDWTAFYRHLEAIAGFLYQPNVE